MKRMNNLNLNNHTLASLVPDSGVDTLEPVNLSLEVYTAIRKTIGSRPAESGGMLGSTDGGKTVDLFALDHKAYTNGAVYIPNTDYLNAILTPWDAIGAKPMGIIHSHPDGCTYPSTADMQSADAYIRAVPSFGGHMEMPIVQLHPFRILWYTVFPTRSGLPRLVPRKVTVDGKLHFDPYQRAARHETMIVPEKELFQRVESVFPLSAAKRKVIVSVGVGGGRDFLCALARTGIGTFILIDGDTIDPPNVATQGVNATEIGLKKVDACAAAIKSINPYAKVVTFPRMLDETVSDNDFVRMTGRVLLERSTDILMCALTDSFEANARAAQLAVKYGTPFLQGLVYQYGSTAEICFSYPGVTPACPRCCQTSRYNAYLSGSVQRIPNASTGCPISATAILNAYKLEVAEELLFYHEEGSPYSSLLDEHAGTNLLFVRLGQQLPKGMEGSTYDRATSQNGKAVVGAVFWDTIHPDTDPECPLCHGTGDLRNVIGRQPDTRLIV